MKKWAIRIVDTAAESSRLFAICTYGRTYRHVELAKKHITNSSEEVTVTLWSECNHYDLIEIGMLVTCDYGCKLMLCKKCGMKFDSHRRIYGCKSVTLIFTD